MNPKCLFNLYSVDFDFIVISPTLGLLLRDSHEKWRLRLTEWFTRAHALLKSRLLSLDFTLRALAYTFFPLSLEVKLRKIRLVMMQEAPVEREGPSLEFMEEKRKDLLQAQVHNGDMRSTWNTCLIRTGYLTVFQLQPLVRNTFYIFSTLHVCMQPPSETGFKPMPCVLQLLEACHSMLPPCW